MFLTSHKFILSSEFRANDKINQGQVQNDQGQLINYLFYFIYFFIWPNRLTFQSIGAGSSKALTTVTVIVVIFHGIYSHWNIAGNLLGNSPGNIFNCGTFANKLYVSEYYRLFIFGHFSSKTCSVFLKREKLKLFMTESYQFQFVIILESSIINKCCLLCSFTFPILSNLMFIPKKLPKIPMGIFPGINSIYYLEIFQGILPGNIRT